MDLENLAGEAKRIVDERGGPKGIEQDAQELEGIARGDGSTGDKVKQGVDALRQPGAADQPPQGAADQPPQGASTGGDEAR